MRKKISIAMTTYNGECYIGAQLQSLLDQTRPADEVVIFDDCSTDGTTGIIQRFIRDNGLRGWHLTVNKTNLGYKENFYQAVAHTSGDIIFLCDQDDIWHPDKIKIMLGIFEKNKDIKVLYSSFEKINQAGDHVKETQRPGYVNHGLLKGNIKSGQLRKIRLKQIMKGNISPGCTMGFVDECKTFYLKNASRLIFHDWELSIFGALMNGLYFYNRELVSYRLHSNNTIGLNQKLPTLLMKFTMKKDQSGRVNEAEMECRRIQPYVTESCLNAISVREKRFLVQHDLFARLRYEALSKRSIVQWGRALLCVSYINMVGFRGIAGDLIFIIKN